MKLKMRMISWKKEKADFMKVVSKLKFKQLIPALILPVLSFIVFLLPQKIQQNMKLIVKEPRIWQYITSAYIHHDINHLLNNLGLYLILTLLLIYLALQSDKIREFNRALALSLILFPIISSIANILIFSRTFNNLQTNCGASGLVGMMVGFLPAFWVQSMHPKSRSGFGYMNILALYLALMLVITYTKNITAMIIVGVFIVGYIINIRKDIKSLLKNVLLVGKKHFIFFVTATTAILIFFVAPSILFPSALIAANKTMVNFFTHYLGAVYGLVISFVVINFDKLKEKIKTMFHKPTIP